MTNSTPITTFPLVPHASNPHRTSSQLNWSAVKMIATKTSPTISRPNIFFSPYVPRFCLGQNSPAYVSRCAARHKNTDCICSSIPNCRHDCVRVPAIAELTPRAHETADSNSRPACNRLLKWRWRAPQPERARAHSAIPTRRHEMELGWRRNAS